MVVPASVLSDLSSFLVGCTLGVWLSTMVETGLAFSRQDLLI
jgi:hypothetical protein